MHLSVSRKQSELCYFDIYLLLLFLNLKVEIILVHITVLNGIYIEHTRLK